MVRQFEAALGDGAHERLLARIPMQRFGEPDEVAALVVFLLSSDASYVNGGIYTVDGASMA
jgi:NAD(P)-dependent dehydrogenase (short-subunit alcohol dehydrogenase family)